MKVGSRGKLRSKKPRVLQHRWCGHGWWALQHFLWGAQNCGTECNFELPSCKLLEDVRFFYPMRPDAMVLRGLSFTVGALQWKNAVRHDTKRKDFQGFSMIWSVFLDDNGQVSWVFHFLDTSTSLSLVVFIVARCRSNSSHGGSKWCWEDLWAASLGTNRTWQTKTKKKLGCWQFSRPKLLKYFGITVVKGSLVANFRYTNFWVAWQE